MLQVFKSSILAGLYIGIASLMYIKVGGVIGACLFSFGLVAVICSGSRLYTGQAGFIQFKVQRDWDELLVTLVGNVIGCFGIAIISLTSLPGTSDLAISVVECRLEKSWWEAGLLGIGCGFLMTTAVSNLKPWVENKNWLPLFFSVPIFILCGFLHSIADSFYYMACGLDYFLDHKADIVVTWLFVVAGNLVGCNIPRALYMKQPK